MPTRLGRLLRGAAWALAKQATCTLRYWESSEKKLLKSGVITLDETGRVLRMTEKSPAPEPHWFSVAFLFPRQDDGLVSQAIEDGCGVDAPGSYLRWPYSHRPVYAMEMSDKRHDMGDLTSCKQVQKEYPGIVR